MIEFECDGCGNPIRLAESAAGKRGKCPKCGKVIRVPSGMDSVVDDPADEPPPFPRDLAANVERPSKNPGWISAIGIISIFLGTISLYFLGDPFGDLSAGVSLVLRVLIALALLSFGFASIIIGKRRFQSSYSAERKQADFDGAHLHPIFEMVGVQDVLHVFEDKVTIEPFGVLGFLNKGMKGKKTIPIASISATQFKKAGQLSGFIQFSIPGGNESNRGLLAAVRDENSFVFRQQQNNDLAAKIVQYVESKMRELQSPKTFSQPVALADELRALAKLRDQGILSDDEFLKAKAKLFS